MKLLIYEDELSLPQPSFQLCRCLKRGNSVSLEGIKTKCRGKLILPPADLKCVHRETAQRYLFCFCSSVQNLAGHPYNFFYTCNGCLFQFPNILRSFRNRQGSKVLCDYSSISFGQIQSTTSAQVLEVIFCNKPFVAKFQTNYRTHPRTH